MARSKEQSEPTITAQQQRFIEVLLTGKSITEAATIVGCSRRAATYWLAKDGNPVRQEYERQATERTLAFTSRVAKLHDLALSTLEDMMVKKRTPPWVRYQVAKLIYERHLADYGGRAFPQRTRDLVMEAYAEEPSSVEWLMTDERGRERPLEE